MLRTCLLGCFVLLLAAPLRAQFQPQTTYATGSYPWGIAVGDFNGDGKLDVAVTNGSDNTVSILLGNGDGTFQPHVDYPTGTRPTSVVVGDFNRDGNLDLAITTLDNTVNVLLGHGDGTFRPHVDYATGLNPQWLAVADFNGDGYVDIATANYGPNYQPGSVSILLGNGDGTFQGQAAYPAGINPFGIMTGDFNRDGKIDLAVLNNNGSFGIYILLGNGDGSFQSPVFYPTGENPRVGVVADFTGDGNLDLAVGDCIDNNIAVLLGNGNGTFQNPVYYQTGDYVSSLAGGDFDGDGKLDLVTADAAFNSVSFLKGNGDGTFQANVDFPVGSDPGWVAVADVNHDNAPDLVVANYSGNSVSILLNKGTDFSISASAASPGTVSLGQTSTSTLTMNLLTTFHNPVTLACSVQPVQAAPTCSFSQNPVPFDDSGNATAILTIDTGTAVDALLGSSSPRHESLQVPFLWLPIVGFALLGVGSSSRRAPRKKLTACVLGFLLFGGLIFQAACTRTRTEILQSQTYTITVTGTSGSSQHSTTMTLVVQQPVVQ